MALRGFALVHPYRPHCPRPSLAVRATAAPTRHRDRRHQNVDGEFFVDRRCIDCDACRWMAPETFSRIDGQSAVVKQPSCQEERLKALQALLSCPTSSIHTEKPPKEIVEVQKMFPLPIDEQRLPGVYHCGYHSERSYGATSYLIAHPDGNILVDSPRYTPKLAQRIDMLGGAKYMFLTHKDDVGDHEKWFNHLRCKRIIHAGDVEPHTADVEMQLQGEGPWSISTDFELIHTPGHTEGSVCLYYKPLKILFTGDHFAKSKDSELSIFEQYNRVSVSLQLNSVRKLLDLDFLWILPGHGRRVEFKDSKEKNLALETFLAGKEHALPLCD
ncbi:Metallo-hydrolase/oxidoreductase protein [Dioscorea alata]|uniref:Metallo-hydrolase/oxidoreductase protein n=1 Tax=Dioscorea alata TaxID=55571 RepID=A0ACB7V6S9_DIOAL|nr:Metallo-hydrolase/oxidoreductase protein [Dioscorea alata]